MITLEQATRQFTSSCQPFLSFNRREEQSPLRWQQAVRPQLLQCLGIRPTPGLTPQVDVLESEQQDGYRREKIIIQADDGLGLPCYLLIPDGVQGPMPACIALHGHCSGKNIPAGIPRNKADRELIAAGRDFAVQAVREGYIALAPDVRGFGELMLDADVKEDRPWSCVQLSGRYLHAGSTLLGRRVLDVMTCVDYLVQRPEVDASRIVLTGQSGGGTITLYAMNLDPRIAAAAPSCSFCTFTASILDIYHCPCNYVPGLQNLLEMADVAGLYAPKPLLVIAGKTDSIFPVDDVKRAYEELRSIYAAFGAVDNLELFVGPEGHRYYADRVWDFFRERLT